MGTGSREERIAYLECIEGIFPRADGGDAGVVSATLTDLPRGHIKLGLRGEVEEDFSKLQIIATTVFVDSNVQRVLVVRKPDRSCKGSPESGSSLLWVGGHAGDQDLTPSVGTLRQLARDAAERECWEELGIFPAFIDYPPFFVYSTFEEHSRKHLAICHLAVLEDSSRLNIDEGELVGRSEGGGVFLPIEDIEAACGNYPLERWSMEIAAVLKARRLDILAATEKRLHLGCDMSDREAFASFIGDGAIDGRYRLCRGADGVFRKLGDGGSGIVYLARQGLVEGVGVRRAIKFFLFDDKRAGEEQTSVSKANFEKEVGNIVLFNHQNILKVIDGGYVEESVARAFGLREPVPYLVTEYIDGHTLKDYMVRDDLEFSAVIVDESHAFELILQLIDGITYLHERKFFHCDIAPKNLFFQGEGRSSTAVLGDLGAGVTLSDEARKTYKDSMLRVIGTKGYAPEPIAKMIQGRTAVTFDEFKSLQPAWDAFGTRKTIKDFCVKAKQALSTAGCGHKNLSALASELERHGDACSIEDIRRAVESLHPDRHTVANVPELTEAGRGTYTRPLPLSPVVLSSRFRAVIEHPSFSRLQNVPQLLSIPTVFPGANHTRFEHSLGTYEVMRRVLTCLLRREEIATVLDRRSIELALLGALLLGINRFPFWYAFGEAGALRPGDDETPGLSEGELYDLAMGGRRESGSLASTVSREFRDINLDALRTVVCSHGLPGDADDSVLLIRALLHSSLDVRVLDYLMRDAYHLGRENVPDFYPLYEHLDYRSGSLAVHAEGLNYAEQVAAQRYWMFKTVYWNQPNRLYSAALSHALYRLPASKVRVAVRKDFANLTTRRMIEIIVGVAREEHDSETEGFVRTHLSERPPRFRRLYAANRADPELPDGIRRFFDVYKTSPISWREGIRSALQEALESEFGIDGNGSCRLLIDIPDSAWGDMGSDVLVISSNGSQCAPLSGQSGIVQGINDHFDEQLRWLRVFAENGWKRSCIGSEEKEARAREVIVEVFTSYADGTEGGP